MAIKQNPFTHEFEEEPFIYVETELEREIYNNFSFDRPSEGTYLITGVRGSGKTVMTSRIAKRLHDSNQYEIISLNSSKDMVLQLASRLAELPYIHKCFIKGNININMSFISTGIEFNKDKVFDIETLISKMLRIVRDEKKKVLVLLDDIAATDEMRKFAKCYQNLISDMEQYPIYLLMTGVKNNYDAIINDEKFNDCTFLTRSNPKEMQPLDEMKIAIKYLELFPIEEDEAIRLAKKVKGYAYAFQVLGYLLFQIYEEKKSIKNFDFSFLAELESSYVKLWSEITDKERMIIKCMAELGPRVKKVKRSEIVAKSGVNNNTLAKIKIKLESLGLIICDDGTMGMWSIALPEFGTYAIKKDIV